MPALNRREYMKKYSKEWYLNHRLKVKEQRKRYYQENREQVIAKNKAWRKNNPDKLAAAKRRYHLKHDFGLSITAYEELLLAQKGLCAVCRHRPPKSLAVDHCHTTGKIRGLLCVKCNRGIGLFVDNAALLERAAMYIKESYDRT